MHDEDFVIIIAEDDFGHAALIKMNLEASGITSIMHFVCGSDVLDYLKKRGGGDIRRSNSRFVILLDIRMPGLDGIGVLKILKEDEELKKIPVFMLTTTDDPQEIEQCFYLGCNSYITKPLEYEKFVNVIRQLGNFIMAMKVPVIN